jgi:glycosyltransferase involved in cell wall biosynthesis
MLTGHNIICFSNDWDQDPLSKHHIMGRLARNNRILWINSIGMRTPTADRRDLVKIGGKLRSFFKGPQRVQDNLYVLSPLAIPFHGSELTANINGALLLRQVRYYQRKLNFENPILWYFLPNVISLFGCVGEKLSLYYITDDFTQFSGYPAKAIEKIETFLIKKCDVVIASAKRLAEKKTRNGKEIIVVRHGVDHHHFAQALSLSPKDWPADIKEMKRPIVGFYGEINNWLDLNLLAEAARKKPEWSFVLIGRIGVEVGNIGFLTELANVHYLGQKKFEELPAYCAAFDVALIPMKINELTLNVNPLKLREYLAAGVPVVSAPLPEVLSYGDVVKFATTVHELIAATDELLKKDRKTLAPNLSQRVANVSWDAKVEDISEIIDNALRCKTRASVKLAQNTSRSVGNL